MKTILIFVIFLTSQAAFAFEYSSCQDPNYIQYVAKRLDFYDKVSARSYEEAQEELRLAPFDTLSKSEKTLYLYSNTVLSARFDSTDIALKNIEQYEAISTSNFLTNAVFNFLLKRTSNMTHKTNIARGWLALKTGQKSQAIKYLFASTEVGGSATLGSFGPDKSLIRELYRQGEKEAVLEYLKRSASFWNTESAQEYITLWNKMITNDCAIQFQFYDTTSTRGFTFE